MPSDLSGGMKKRVAIARALVIEPQLILYDEPTSELDPLSAVVVAEEILHLQDRIGVTSLVVSHDRDLAFGVADRIAVINQGRILTIGTPDEVKGFNDPVRAEILARRFSTRIPIKPMKNSLETRLGVFAVLVIIAALLIVETLGGIGFFQRGYHLSALFNSAQELKAGDSVKMAGVEIGRVEKVALENDKVKVTMKLHPDAVVKTDSKAIIRFIGLMGQILSPSVSVRRMRPRRWTARCCKPKNSPISTRSWPSSMTPPTASNDLATRFPATKSAICVGPLVDFVKQNSGNIGGAISNIDNITGQIASGQGTVGKLIYTETLYDSAWAPSPICRTR